LGVDRKGAHRPALRALKIPDLVHRIKEAVARMNCHKGGADALTGEDRGRQLAGSEVEAKEIDSIAGLLSVGADVDEHLLGLRPISDTRSARRGSEPRRA